MNITEALAKLSEGEAIVREVWNEAEGYLVLMPKMKNVWKILTSPNPNAGNHIFNVDELLANDWKLLEVGCDAIIEAAPKEGEVLQAVNG